MMSRVILLQYCNDIANCWNLPLPKGILPGHFICTIKLEAGYESRDLLYCNIMTEENEHPLRKVGQRMVILNRQSIKQR